MFRKLFDEGRAGEVGVLRVVLNGKKSNVDKYWQNQVQSSHTKFESEVYILEQR